MPYKTIIFDLDGVLIDSSSAIVKSFNHALESMDYKKQDEPKVRSLIGIPLARMFGITSGIYDKETITALRAAYLEKFEDITKEESYIYDGVADTLQYLWKKSIMMYVASNKHQAAAKKVLKTMGLISYFKEVIGWDNVKEPKPAPEMILKCLKISKTRKEDAIMVGDTASDIIAAKGAGITSIGIKSGFGTEESLKVCHPDYLISKINEIKKILK